MMTTPFYINNRFCIDPSTNQVSDEIKGRSTRVEPRFIEVLCLLSQNHGSTVSREELVAVVWKDYGGGDEGLTQAISALRKLLDDGKKELIQTVPKKGYCLQGQVSHQRAAAQKHGSENRVTNSKNRMKVMILAGILACLSLFAYFVFQKNSTSEKLSSTPVQVPFPGMDPAEDHSLENASNTVTTTGPDSTIYKLVMIGDEPPKFYINNKLLPVGSWEPYQELINKLKREMRKR